MKPKDVGGNAFPIDETTRGDGMTLLDYFAAQALSGMLSFEDKAEAHTAYEDLLKSYAEVSYDYAEAMLAEKRRRQWG